MEDEARSNAPRAGRPPRPGPRPARSSPADAPATELGVEDALGRPLGVGPLARPSRIEPGPDRLTRPPSPARPAGLRPPPGPQPSPVGSAAITCSTRRSGSPHRPQGSTSTWNTSGPGRPATGRGPWTPTAPRSATPRPAARPRPRGSAAGRRRPPRPARPGPGTRTGDRPAAATRGPGRRQEGGRITGAGSGHDQAPAACVLGQPATTAAAADRRPATAARARAAPRPSRGPAATRPSAHRPARSRAAVPKRQVEVHGPGPPDRRRHRHRPGGQRTPAAGGRDLGHARRHRPAGAGRRGRPDRRSAARLPRAARGAGRR